MPELVLTSLAVPVTARSPLMSWARGGQPLGEGPEVTQAQRIHRQAAQRGQDAHSIGLVVAMRVLAELGVAGPRAASVDAVRLKGCRGLTPLLKFTDPG